MIPSYLVRDERVWQVRSALNFSMPARPDVRFSLNARAPVFSDQALDQLVMASLISVVSRLRPSRSVPKLLRCFPADGLCLNVVILHQRFGGLPFAPSTLGGVPTRLISQPKVVILTHVDGQQESSSARITWGNFIVVADLHNPLASSVGNHARFITGSAPFLEHDCSRRDPEPVSSSGTAIPDHTCQLGAGFFGCFSSTLSRRQCRS